MDSTTILRALAEPRRQEIVRIVRDMPRSVTEIAERLGITQQAVSQHLKVLADAGLVEGRAQGRQRIYALKPDGIAALERFLSELLPPGPSRLTNAAGR